MTMIEKIHLIAIAAAILLIFAFVETAAAIDCQEKIGDVKKRWSWRDVDGRRCWFVMPPDGHQPSKVDLRWQQHKAEEQQVIEKTIEKAEEKIAEPEAFVVDLKTRSLPDGYPSVAANWLSDAPIDLLDSETISGQAGVGWWLIVPSSPAIAVATR
jgi:hypothetical protein